MSFTMKVRDFHSMDGRAARQSGRLSMMGVYYGNGNRICGWTVKERIRSDGQNINYRKLEYGYGG